MVALLLLLLNGTAARGATGWGPAAGGLTTCRVRLTMRCCCCCCYSRLVPGADISRGATAGGRVNGGARYQRLAEAAASIAAHSLMLLVWAAACCCPYVAAGG